MFAERLIVWLETNGPKMEALWRRSPVGSDAIERFPWPPEEAPLFVKLTSGNIGLEWAMLYMLMHINGWWAEQMAAAAAPAAMHKSFVLFER
jgi:hypothetical protein